MILRTISEQVKSDIYNRIGRNIKKYRKLKQLTQRELAELSLVSENLIAKLESTTHQTISIDTLEVIANTLEVDITKLLEKN